MVYLNPSALEFLQTLWTSIQGTGGVIDTMGMTQTSRATIVAIVTGLIAAIGDQAILKAPRPNIAAARQHADETALRARRPRAAPQQPETALLGRRKHLAPQQPDTGLLTRRQRVQAPLPDQSLLARRTRLPAAPSKPNPTFANLPVSPVDGQHDFIIDCNVAAATNFGVAAAGGGANHVPVYYDQGTTTWRMG